LERLESTVARRIEFLTARASGSQPRVVSFRRPHSAALEEWAAQTGERLDRIERRLKLAEKPP